MNEHEIGLNEFNDSIFVYVIVIYWKSLQIQ